MGDLVSGQLDLLGGLSDPDPVPAGPTTLLIIDTETTGLDPELDHCLEVGVILFSVASRTVLAQQSFLLPVESNAAEHINRIPADVTSALEGSLAVFPEPSGGGRSARGAQRRLRSTVVWSGSSSSRLATLALHDGRCALARRASAPCTSVCA